jgi:hypothetical protein
MQDMDVTEGQDGADAVFNFSASINSTMSGQLRRVQGDK